MHPFLMCLGIQIVVFDHQDLHVSIISANPQLFLIFQLETFLEHQQVYFGHNQSKQWKAHVTLRAAFFLILHSLDH